MLPPVGASRSAIRRKRVVLPQPEGPMSETNPRRRPFVNWALIAACVAVYAYQVWLQEGGDQALIRSWGLIPARLLADPSGAWPTLLSHAFLHGSLLHLGGNMLFLWIFGDNVE